MLLRAPSQLEEAANRVAGKQTDDDGHVSEGRSNQGPEARSGRFWPFITGFPFPLGPLLTRQTVRQEVCKAHMLPWIDMVCISVQKSISPFCNPLVSSFTMCPPEHLRR